VSEEPLDVAITEYRPSTGYDVSQQWQVVSRCSRCPNCAIQQQEATQRLLRESDRVIQGSKKQNEGTKMKFTKIILTISIAFAISLGAFAQSDNGSPKQDAKDAAHSTGQAAKKTGHQVKKGTKKAVHKSADTTRKGSEKVEDKTATPK
jgi:hypothetical protein